MLSTIWAPSAGQAAGRRSNVEPGQVLEKLAVLERDVEVLTCDARVLSRDRVGTGPFAPADRVDERVVLMLRDEQDLPRIG